jgi:teichuronic acid biosynthesis glycosyltransferase TuaG
LGGERVSIITPAYNAAGFIGEAVDSVRMQDHLDWEMLIVDDCSPDDTCAKVDQQAARDPRVRLIRQTRNGGPAAARNLALAQATGRYIAFLDSDDLWMPHKLTRQLAFMRARDAALSFTSLRRITQDGSRVGRLIGVPDKLDYDQLLCDTAIVTSSVIMDREKTGDVRMPDAPYDDYALWLKLTKAGHVAWGLPEDLLRYRVVTGSVSRSKRVSAHRVWQTYRDIESLGLVRSAWSFTNYAVRGWLKYRKF